MDRDGCTSRLSGNVITILYAFQPSPPSGFMARQTTHFWRSTASAVDYMPVTDDIEEQLSEDDDIATMAGNLDTQENLIAQQYVVYSATFQVPAFYFTVHDSSVWVS